MEQFSILPLGTFPAAGEDQHRGVQAGGIGTGPALGNNDLDEEDFASRRHGCSAVGQDSGRRFVVPVVHDPLQQVGVPAGWHGFTRAPLFVNGRSQQKRVISGRLTMQMTRYNRARKMRRSSHASPAATGTRLAQPTPWSVHPAVGARRLRWHEDLPANRPDQDIWFERWPEPSSPSARLPQRTATGARHATGIGLPGRAQVSRNSSRPKR